MNAHKLSAQSITFAVVFLAAIVVFPVSQAESSIITDANIVSIPEPAHVVHSGNGQLDLILFTFANGVGVNNNELKDTGVTIFNGDNANTQMPVGTGNIGTSAAESYITSIGDLRNFYTTTFSDGQGGSTINQIVLFVDLCQTGQGGGGNSNDFITLQTLNIVVDYDAFQGSDPRNDPWSNDLDCATQNATGSAFTGGTTVANLDPTIVPRTLPVTAHGSGWADCMIFTGIDPFDVAFTDQTPILFFWESTDHTGGGTDVFISGAHVPEPGAMMLLGLGGLGMLLRRRRK